MSTSISDTTSEAGWTPKFKISEMLLLLEDVPDAAQCLERSEMESMVREHFSSMEEARAILESKKESKKKAKQQRQGQRRNDPLERLQRVLSQDRAVLNFDQYTTSTEHNKRMAVLKEKAPELFDDPNLTPRSKWFNHKHWNRNSQMPPFHVHFRVEMQDVLRLLYEAYAASTKNPKTQMRAIRNANSHFNGCMRGLSGHVRIEEYACFPLFKKAFPHADVSFLEKDHKHLHKKEKEVNKAFSDAVLRLSAKDCIPPDQVLALTETVLDFDDCLMAHLGEEEELVVPMSLTDKEIMF